MHTMHACGWPSAGFSLTDHSACSKNADMLMLRVRVLAHSRHARANACTCYRACQYLFLHSLFTHSLAHTCTGTKGWLSRESTRVRQPLVVWHQFPSTSTIAPTQTAAASATCVHGHVALRGQTWGRKNPLLIKRSGQRAGRHRMGTDRARSRMVLTPSQPCLCCRSGLGR
jgi:hypothetical protein